MGFDHLRGAFRTFRCDRILSASPGQDRFTLRPKSDFAQALEGNEELL